MNEKETKTNEPENVTASKTPAEIDAAKLENTGQMPSEQKPEPKPEQQTQPESPKPEQNAQPPLPTPMPEQTPKPPENAALAEKADPANNFERLLDVEMNVTVRFGMTEIPLREAVNFGIGSMIELNRSVDEPVELLVNNFPFARGEVVVIDGYYGVRVTEIGSPEERTKTLFSTTN